MSELPGVPPPPRAIEFVVLGRPQGKGSKRVLPIRTPSSVAERRVVLVDSNRKAAPWATEVKAAAIEAWGRYQELMRGPVRVELSFYFRRPRWHFGTGKNHGRLKPSAPTHITTMPDLDKLVRCSLDALVGIVIADDAQAADLIAFKRYGEPERLAVRVRELGE
jgi:crossover junction endodeoxyribonuclease RusA